MHTPETYRVGAPACKKRVGDPDLLPVACGVLRHAVGTASRTSGKRPQHSEICRPTKHLSDQSAARFLNLALGREILDNLVQHAVDECARSGGGVVFRNLDPLVEGNFHGNRRKGCQLRYRGGDDQVVHEDYALDIPVGCELLQVGTVCAVIYQRLLEQGPDECRIVIALELGGHLQLRVRGTDRGEGTQYHRDYIAQIVAPHHRHLLQLGIQRITLLHPGKELFQEAAVVVERTLPVRHILLIVVALYHLGIDGADHVGRPLPTQLAEGNVVADTVAVCYERYDSVLHEFGVGI